MILHLDTPLLYSHALSEQLNKQLWLKMDALQPSGSFKIRGIGYACQHYAQQGKTRFVSSSGGNAGIAVAYAGRRLNIPTLVVVPETTSEHARRLIQREKAELLVVGRNWNEANDHAQALLQENDAFIHPFDDPLLWKGHASLIAEVAAQGIRPDAILLSVGGGGLLSGIAQGMQDHGWQDTPIIAVETHGTASLGESVRQRKHVTLDSVQGIATTLAARQVCTQAYSLSQTRPIHCAQVSDAQAVSACLRFLTDHRVLVEPACGAMLATAYLDHEVLAPYQNILAIVCGGSTSTLAQLVQWKG
ncbi:pyridoxal-phosphate dependent enzyme [Alcaligenes sp. SDU_A2]|uniref:pyridoxal-phosphate dependent enzyme n=1 Tax=Alcaligenes sp. SDU_A2 TaxID=3136634 RepID=UPI002CE08CF1|nr:pyridoxal-phosphate dependent enzyme [Alcaligenes faecalis]